MRECACMCTGSEREVRINCVHACVHAGSDRAAACRGKRREEQGCLAACAAPIFLAYRWRESRVRDVDRS